MFLDFPRNRRLFYLKIKEKVVKIISRSLEVSVEIKIGIRHLLISTLRVL